MTAVRHLTTEELAERLGVSASVVKKWRRVGGGPAYIQAGAQPRYREQDIEAWEETRLVPAMPPMEPYRSPRTSRRRHLRTA